jgi:hypothetical protein
MKEFSVGCLFKNEEHAIVEWIEHYLYHGAEHFYLINDDSTDNSVNLIQKYIDDGIVSLFNGNNWGKYLGRQRDLYNHFILPRINETKWLLICDMDEFLYSPTNIDLKEVLCFCKNLSQIQINHTFFSSSGHIEQPKCLVKYFTYKHCDNTNGISYKYIVNSDYKFSSLNIHHATYVDENDKINKFLILNDYFILNHYRIQSLNFWKNVKCTRGDADNYIERTLQEFYEQDKNDIQDIKLWEQNKNMDYYINL